MDQPAEKPERADAPRWLLLAPAVFLLLWSGGFAFAKMALVHAEPLTLLVLRYAFVLAVLLPLVPFVRPPLPKTRSQWLHLAVVGFLIQAVYFGLCYLGFSLGVSAGAMALIVSLQPILVALLAPRFAGEGRVGLLRWAGLALGLLGAALVIMARSEVETTSIAGLLCAGGGLAAMTVATLYEKVFGVTHHPVTANLLQYAVGLAGVFPLAFFLEDMSVDWTGELVIAMAYLVIGNSLVAITLLLAMIRYGEASRVSALFFLVPPGAALIAWGLIGEVLPPLAWLGMIVAALGVAVAGRPAPRIRRS